MLAISLAVLTVAACGFSADFAGTRYRCGAGGACPVGFTCVADACRPDDDPLDAALDGAGPRTWRSDTSADFTTAGFVAVSAAVDPRGAIEPFAYYTGGVLVRASATALGTSAATWEQASAAETTPWSALTRSTDVAYGAGVPPGLGLTSPDAWTLRFEGEVWLEAGDWTFLLLVDDHGFLDVADAAGSFRRVVSAAFPDEREGVVSVAVAGWYPVRWVASDEIRSGSWRLRFRGPGMAAPTAIPRDRLRVRVDAIDGLVLTAFDGERLAGSPAITIDATAPASVDWALAAPTDLGLTRVDDFSTRWSGQLYVEVAGTYRLRYVSDDGQRLWIDGVLVLDVWDGASHERVSPPLELAAGWLDVVIDHSERAGRAKAQLTIDSGPDLGGQPLPVARLRPVEGRGERHETAGNPTDIPIPDAPSATVDGVASSTVTLTAPPGAVVRGLDVGFRYDHENQAGLTIVLVAPDGRVATLRDQTGTAAGTITEQHHRTDLDGAPAGGTWTLRFTDVEPAAVGTIRDVQLTVHTAGAGQPPIANTATFDSAPYDLGSVATLGAVRWHSRQPEGTSVAVRLRTCGTAAACAQAPWSAALPDPTGSVPSLPPAAFAQYRIELTSTGDRAASLESIEVDYHRP